METEFIESTNKIRSQEGVIAFQCCDKNGLCLKSFGKSVNSSACGYIASLSNRSHLLAPKERKQQQNTAEYPVILIESDKYRLFIKGNGSVTVAVYKEQKKEE
jgi:hypothetical protein